MGKEDLIRLLVQTCGDNAEREDHGPLFFLSAGPAFWKNFVYPYAKSGKIR